MSYCIQVVDPCGNVMYARHGFKPCVGPIVQWPSRQKALDHVAFLKIGMEEGEDYESIAVVPFHDGLPEEDVEGDGCPE